MEEGAGAYARLEEEEEAAEPPAHLLAELPPELREGPTSQRRKRHHRGPGHLGDRFSSSPGYKDPFFAILFLAHLALVLFLSVYNGTKFLWLPSTPLLKTGSYSQVVGALTACVFVAGAVSAGLLLVLRLFARGIVLLSMGGTLVALLVLWISLLSSGHWLLSFGVLSGLVANGWYFYWARQRVEFATATLTIVVGAVRLYPATIAVACASLLVTMGWASVWAMSALYSVQLASAASYHTVAFLYLLSLYWTSQVFSNVVHVTVAGTVASWYFHVGAAGEGDRPRAAAWGSLRRACTWSLGSIALGSLLVAFFRAARAALRAAARLRWSRPRQAAEWALGALERAALYFNAYAYAHVAIYGKPYLAAARDTCRLLRDRGLDAVVNDNIVAGVAVWGSVLGGTLTATLVGPWARRAADQWLPVTTTAFLLGYVIVQQAMAVLESGVVALFVCFAEDPKALQRTKPAVYRHLTEAWIARWGYLPASASPAPDEEAPAPSPVAGPSNLAPTPAPAPAPRPAGPPTGADKL
eukprot:tig00020537_g10261.t1